MSLNRLSLVYLLVGLSVLQTHCGPVDEDVPTGNAILDDDDGIAGGGGTDSFGTIDHPVTIAGVPWISQKFSCASWDETRTCGPTAAAMAVSYLYNKPLNEASVRSLVESIGQKWPCGNYTSVSILNKMLTDKSILNVSRVFDASQLLLALDAGHPIIAPVYGQNFSTNQIKPTGNVGHFMLIVGVERDYIIANDPGRSLRENGEYRRFHINDFLQAWWGSGRYKGIEVIGPAICDNGPTVQTCGACSTQTRTCSGGIWSDWSACKSVSCTNPMLTLTPNSGARGTLFTLHGSGFTPSGRVGILDRRPDGTMPQLPETLADGSGNVVYSLQSSSSTLIGTFTIWGIDLTTVKSSNQVPLIISASQGQSSSPSISMSPTQGPRGTVFLVNGSGFTTWLYHSLKVVRPDGSSISFQPFTDGTGTFQYSLPTTAMTLTGNFTVTVTDGTTGAVSNFANFTVTL